MNASVSRKPSNDGRPGAGTPGAALAAGGLAALAASTCCIGPLVLAMLGLGSAWAGHLRALEPLSPVFAAAAFFALALAWRRIYRPATACKPGEVCAIPQARQGYRVWFWLVAGFAAAAIAFPWVLMLLY